MILAVTRTEAEQQLARQFASVAAELPGGDWVPEARARAMAAFERSGLPHRRIEEWKYTDLRTGLRTAFPPASCSLRSVDETMLAPILGPDLGKVTSIRLVLVNGRVVARFVPPGLEPAGWHVSALSGVLGQADAVWLRDRFGTDDAPDAISALNTAFATDGFVLRIAEGCQLDVPIHIVSLVDAEAPVAVATRNIVRIERGARATLIESHVGLGRAADARQVTAMTQLSVGEAGEAHHIQHVSGGSEAVHLARWEIELAAAAVYHGFQLTSGAGLARNESSVRFTGPAARLDLSGLMLGRGRDHIDTTLVVDHTHPGCESREHFKAVLDGRARAVFQGKIVVAPEAQKTDGRQMAQALMLSEEAEFDSKPELEIYADDVACGHGSTATELDPSMLFYLRSRGIPLAEARALLIQSFAADALDKIGEPLLREAMEGIAFAWLGARDR